MKVFTRQNFAMAHRLLGHEKCGKLHGHTWTVEAGVEGEKGKEGMIMDFSLLDSVVRKVIERFDHKTCLKENDPLICDLPSGTCVLLPDHPTCETLAQTIGEEVKNCLKKEGKSFSSVTVRIYESPRHWVEVVV